MRRGYVEECVEIASRIAFGVELVSRGVKLASIRVQRQLVENLRQACVKLASSWHRACIELAPSLRCADVEPWSSLLLS